jgi:hypothetical protein
MAALSRTFVWPAVAMILVAGFVHLIEAPDSFQEATYKGLLFVANGVGSIIAAIGIIRGKRDWGWGLGFLIAAVSLCVYAASRTIGLPYLPAEPDEWFEPLGVIAMISEVLFLLTTIAAFRKNK